MITPEALAYAIVGTSYNTLTIKSNSTYSSNGTITTIFGAPPATPTATTISSYGYSTTKKFFGLRVGAGTEVLLTNHFGVGADYVYSFYPTYNTSTYQTMQAVACDAVTGCQATPAAVNNTTKTSLSDQQIMAKFIYHIG